MGAVLALALGAGCSGSGPRPAGYAGDDTRDFVKAHRAELEREIGVGSGRTIYDLAIIAGCQDVPQLGRRLHRQRDAIFDGGRGGDDEVAERMVRLLTERRELRCLNLDLSRQREFSAGTRHIGPTRAQVMRRGGTP